MKYAALSWVKATIDDSLKQARMALEQFVENPEDKTPLIEGIRFLHEINGVLHMLQHQTAALLVHEVEISMRFLLAGKLKNDEYTYDILMRTLVQLPNYLDHLVIVKQDMPVALLSLFNGMRSLRQQPALQAANLFTPDLSVIAPHGKRATLTDEKLTEFAKKMLVAYQKGLMTLIKAPRQADGPKFLHGIMQRMQQISSGTPLYNVFWITEGVLENVIQKGIPVNNALVSILKQTGALIKQFADKGNAALRIVPPKPVMHQLLMLAAQSKTKTSRLQEIRQLFDLDGLMPSDADLQAARLIFSGPDIELMKVVITLLKDDFTRIEETLDIFNRADSPSVSELQPLIVIIRDMANILGLLGLNLQCDAMSRQADVIQTICEKQTDPALPAMLEIANALLQISAALDILAVQGVHARSRLQQSMDTRFSETPQFGIVINAVVDEAKTELSQVIQPLVNFIDNNEHNEELAAVPDRLRQVEGFLQIANHEQAASVLLHCNKYIEQIFVKDGKVPEEQALRALADILIGMEFYLDTLAGSPINAVDILYTTENRLKQLH